MCQLDILVHFFFSDHLQNGSFWFTDETVSHIIYVTKFHVMKHEEGIMPWKTAS
ncbi:hypothetical protein SAMN05720606_12457 [Paenibacillus polysaccharolyticus]|uniref:Uncharacterized protein n=1 Tax=Paenibacillus polysaccharolyticus TaxID=582692 RepID=A0A1G5LEF4_9BACL|nr:hypothetical protein SAMN05720606_12457 [Paenibacillus polysaccharolyticus]